MTGPLIAEGTVPILPDNYFVLAEVEDSIAPVTGVVAAVFRADDGPIGEWREVRTLSKLYDTYGPGPGSEADSGVEVGAEVLRAGAVLRAYRVGDDDGVTASLVLNDTGSLGSVQLDWRAAGTNGNEASATVEDSLDDPDGTRELRLFLRGIQKEVIRFPKGATGLLDGELGELKAAIDAAGNRYVTAELSDDYAATGLLVAITSPAAFTGGLNPTVAAADVEVGIGAAEATAGQWNFLVLDSVNTTVQASAVEAASLWESKGIYRVLVLGDPPSVTPDAETRWLRAAAFNQQNVLYGIDSFSEKRDGVTTTVEGAEFAGRLAGMGAVADKRFHISGQRVAGAIGLPNALSAEEREGAILNGAITLNTNDRGAVVVTKGVTTFVTPSTIRSKRWGSLLRVVRRYSYLIDVSRALSDMLFDGRGVDNDEAGRASLVGAAMGVVNDYITQRYFQAGTTVYVDQTEESVDDVAYLAHAIHDSDQIEVLINRVQFP